MPRRPRLCPKDFTAHVIHRGINRQNIFSTTADLEFYTTCLAEAAEEFRVEVHCWAFMSNHVQLLVTPNTDTGVSRLVQAIGRRYVPRFNRSQQRTGGLFEGRFRSSLVEHDGYLLNCLRYIELNPVRAGIVRSPGDYEWSSYRCHAFGSSPSFWVPHSLYLDFGSSEERRQKAYREFVHSEVDSQVLDTIRTCVRTGRVIGSLQFQKLVASRYDSDESGREGKSDP